MCKVVPAVEEFNRGQRVLVTGAGGSMTDWQGHELNIQSDGRVIAAGDPAIALAAREILDS